MLFITKKQFNLEIEKQLEKYIEKGARSLIDDSHPTNKHYVERELVVSYEDMWRMYLRNEWVRACVDKITKSVTNSNLMAVATGLKDGDKPTPEQQKRIDEINKLLDDPNTGIESWKDVRREYLRDVLIYDAGAIEIVYDESGVPAELYSLPGSKVRLNVDSHGNFADDNKAFVCQGGMVDGRKIPDTDFARKEVAYLVANPKSGSMYGLSPLETLYQAVATDLFASKYNSDFFKNNAEASGIIGLEGMSITDLSRFRAYWKKETEKQPHKTVAVNSKVSWTPMNLTNRDMQFLEYQKWLLCKIMTVYAMQPVVLGVIDPTTGKLNSEQQLKSYKEEAVKPLLELETYQLTKVLVQQGFGYDDIKIDYEPIDIEDEVSNADIATKSVTAGIITPNEARKKYYNLGAIEGGDKLVVPNAGISVPPIQ
jgi:HK97 family phage portal protein